METHWFPARSAAEGFLRDHGYAFRGAPDRWGKIDGDGITHAWVHINRGAVVVIGRHTGSNGRMHKAGDQNPQ